ncbi:hypothetical protein ACFXKS_24045 [Streptomyces scopuliridis]|uniref:hypothetical protein n=1 Tax=Streptomyces scopuliridis TaxID=452529 RepID=UPI0036C77F08
MGQLSSTERRRNEEAIRAAMGRLLRGEVPPGGRCDLKTLVAEAGINRTGFYPKKDRVADKDRTIEELAAFTKLALSRLAAQHDEIMHLRGPQPSPEPTPPTKPAPVPRAGTTVISTCS